MRFLLGNQTFRKISTYLSFASFFFLLLFVVSTDSVEAAKSKRVSAGAIVSWKGEVSLFRGSSSSGVIIKGLEPVYVGDTVVTAEKSAAKILLRDDTVLSVGPDSKMQVSKYALSTKQNKRYSVLNIAKGTVRSLVGRVFRGEGSLFRVRTGSAVVGVKGTDFFVSHIGGETEVVSASGRVTVASPDGKGTVMVKPGQISIVKKGKLPSTPKPVSKAKMASLVVITDISVTETDDSGDNSCKKCHQGIHASIVKKKYYHGSAEKKCALCHIKSIDKKIPVKFPANFISREGIIELKGLDKRAPYVLNMSGVDRKGNKVRAKPIKFKPDRIEVKLTDNGIQPTITPLEITKVKQGVFYAVTLSFKTSTATTDLVDYGKNDKLGMKTIKGRAYKTDHNVILKNLKPGKKYFFRAIVEDIFANRSVSEIYSVRVDNKITAKVEVINDPPKILSAKVVKFGGNVYLQYRANKPIKPKVNLIFALSQDKMQEDEKHYPGFKKSIVTNTKVCNECHKGQSHSRLNHSVGVVKWGPGVSNPRGDVPLGPSRSIMCTTCHDAHGSNYRSMLRNEEANLCADCHRSRDEY